MLGKGKAGGAWKVKLINRVKAAYVITWGSGIFDYNIDRVITITDDFYLVLFSIWDLFELWSH